MRKSDPAFGKFILRQTMHDLEQGVVLDGTKIPVEPHKGTGFRGHTKAPSASKRKGH